MCDLILLLAVVWVCLWGLIGGGGLCGDGGLFFVEGFGACDSKFHFFGGYCGLIGFLIHLGT